MILKDGEMTKKQYTSILFLIIGFIFLVMSADMDIGTLGRMGPGMYPLIVSCILILIAIAYSFKSVNDNEPMDLDIILLIKMLTAVIAAIIAFKYVGLLVSILILVPSVASLHKDFNVKDTAISTSVAVALTIILKFTVLKAIPLW